MIRAARPHLPTIIAGVAVGIVWTSLKVLVPTLTRKAIDDGVLAPHGSVVGWVIGIGAAGTISAACAGGRRWFAARSALGVETDLRGMLFNHLIGLDPSFFDHAQTGQLMSRASTDVQQVQGLFMLVPLGICNVAIISSVTVVLLTIDWQLAILSLFALPAMTVLAIRFSRALFPVSVDVQQELAGLATVVEETVSGIRVVKGFGAEATQSLRLRERGDRVFASSLRLGRIRASYGPLLDMVPALGLAAVLWFGGNRVIDNHLSLGTLVAFNAYVLLLVWPLRMMGWIVAQSQRAIAAAARLDELLSVEPLLVSPDAPLMLPARPASAAPATAGVGAVQFDTVTFAYSAGASPVVAELNIDIAAGESVALVGPTGSGKSTIARLLWRAYDVDGGTIRIDGVDVRDLAITALRHAVATVPEDTFLFSASVAANIAFAASRDGGPIDMDVVRRAAALAGATTFIEGLPDGYDTVLGERGQSLSGGQRQRLALARAIVADPRVLVLDDATSAVDPSKEHEIREALATVMAGRTTIVIAHRPATIALADRVLLLDVHPETGDRAHIVAEGTHSGLLQTNRRYREVLARAAILEDRPHDVAAR